MVVMLCLQFEENSQLYELQRLRDTKRLVSEYIAAQIAFHCKAIENLSAAAQAVASFDPDHGMDVSLPCSFVRRARAEHRPVSARRHWEPC